MIKRKIIAVITTGAVILGGITTTAFAMDGGFKDKIKAVRESLKQNIESFHAKKGTVKSAVESKLSEAGFVKIDKESAAPKLQALKDLKGEIQKIRGGLASAKAANDKEKIAALKAELQDKAAQASHAAEALAPYKVQIKNNKSARENLAPLKEQLLAIKNEMELIHEQNVSIRKELHELREQLKAVPKENSEEIQSIAVKIEEKLAALNGNFTKLNTLKEKAANTAKNWQS